MDGNWPSVSKRLFGALIAGGAVIVAIVLLVLLSQGDGSQVSQKQAQATGAPSTTANDLSGSPQAGGGAGSGEATTDVATTRTDRSRSHHHGHRSGPGKPRTATVPAKIVSGKYLQTPFSPELLVPENAWQTASHRRLTYVYAGEYLQNPKRGAFVIFRQNFIHGSQTSNVVQASGAAAIKITRAPLGRKAEVWAQRRGKLHFSDRNGVRGVLHLKDDTVTMTP